MEVKQSSFTICGAGFRPLLQLFINTLMLATIMALISPLTLSAQQILIREADVIESLMAEGVERVEIVNGRYAYANTSDAMDSELAPFLPLVLAILTHDEMEKGSFNRRTPLHDLLPELIEENPFDVPVRIEDLLISSSGFAVPPVDPSLYDRPVDPLLLRRRTPGRISQQDPVGQMLLMKVLEHATGMPLPILINQRFLAPFGLPANAITLGQTTLPSGRITQEGRTHLMRLLLDPGSLSPTPRLPYHAALFEDPFLTTFPGAGYATLGLQVITLEKADMIVSQGRDTCLLAFRPAGVAFWLKDISACQAPYPQALRQIAVDQIIDRAARSRLAALKAQRPNQPVPTRFTGRYIEDTAPSGSLANRLRGYVEPQLISGALKDGRHVLTIGKTGIPLYPAGPYQFETPGGEKAYFSPYRRGGYLLWQGTIYREVGPLGDPGYMFTPVPILLIILLSAIVYWREETSGEWRRMAKLGGMAGVLTSLGMTLELTQWQWALYEAAEGWGLTALLLWRIIMNAGLAFAVAVSVLALIISRKADYPSGAKLYVAPIHLVLLAASGLGLFVILSAWGIAGELMPY